MNLDEVQNFFVYRYRYAIAYTTLIAVSLFSLFFKLGDYLPGLSTNEAELALANSNSSTLIERGLYLPYNVLQWISIELLGPTALAVRLPSAIIGLTGLVMLFALLHMWHKDKIAIAIVVFLATSSWFLNFARYGGPAIYLVFSITALIFFATVLRHKKHSALLLIPASLTLSLTLYAPFMIYLVLLLFMLYRKEILSLFKHLTPAQILLVTAFGGATLMPLIYSFVSEPELIKVWLGWDGSISAFTDYFSNLSNVAAHIFWDSIPLAEEHLGDLAMLDIFTATMIALGLYHYEQHFDLLRTKFLIYGLGISFLVLGLSSQSSNYVLLAPILYILAATGIVTLLRQWNKIFPINPFARTLGLLPMALAILITSNYHLNRYFFAWSENPPVKIIFSEEPTALYKDIEQNEKQAIIIFVPNELQAQARFLTLEAPKTVSIETEIASLEKYNNQTAASIYVHGSFEKPIVTDETTVRTIATNRDSLPIAFNVIER